MKLIWIQALSYDGHANSFYANNHTACPKCPKHLGVHIVSGTYLLYCLRYQYKNTRIQILFKVVNITN